MICKGRIWLFCLSGDPLFCPFDNGRVAQLAEQVTLNH